MSMSTLNAQLAALNGSTKNPGSVLPTSLRHEDAIGRGMHHSVQIGYSTLVNNPKYKPSVLYADAKAAADVPLTALWENCRAALEELQTVFPPLQAYISRCQNSLQSLPLSKRKNARPSQDVSLWNLLFILSSLLQQSEECSSNCLHVLEYLLRRYDVHVHYADTLLITLLPHSEAYPVLFFRLLQLIDVAAVTPWIWLRPYAIAKSKNDATKPSLPSRSLIAKHVIKNTALLNQLCLLTRTVAQLDDPESMDSPEKTSTSRRGVSRILSWSAAIVIEGLVYLQKTELSNSTKESVLRILLPFVLQACRRRPMDAVFLDDWTGWGHILASSLAESMQLTSQVAEVICTSILQGTRHCVENFNDLSQQALQDLLADGFLTVLSVLINSNSGSPLLSWDNAPQESNDDVDIVMFVPKRAFDQAWKLRDHLSTVLGILYEDRNITIELLLESMILSCILQKSGEGGLEVVVEFLGNEKLEKLWKSSQNQMSLNFTKWLVLHVARTTFDGKLKDNGQFKLYQTMLHRLHQLSPSSCDIGIATGVSICPTGTSKAKLARFLDYVFNSEKGEEGSSTVVDMEVDETTSTETFNLLPPRLGVEHSDTAVRLKAVLALANIVVTENEDGVEPVEECLLRRLATDDVEAVAEAAGAAVCGRLENVDNSTRVSSSFLKLALMAIQKWVSRIPSEHKGNSSSEKVIQNIIIQCLTIAGYGVRGWLDTAEESSRREKQLLLETLCSHLDHSTTSIKAAAVKAVLCVMKENKLSRISKKAIDKARLLLCSNRTFIDGLTRTHARGEEDPLEIKLHIRSLWVAAETLAEEKGSLLQQQERFLYSFEFSLMLLGINSRFSSLEGERLQKIITRCGHGLASSRKDLLPRLIFKLASVEDDKAYLHIAKDSIENIAASVLDEDESPVSVFSVLMEAALQRESMELGVSRLLALATDLVSTKPSIWYCIVPALSFIEHTTKDVRIAAIKLLDTIGKNLENHSQLETDTVESLKDLCDYVSKLESSATIGGGSFVVTCLASGIPDVRSASGCKTLLELCACSITATGQVDFGKRKKSFGGSWLPFGQANGGCRAAALILASMGLAGERKFPLETRWDLIGRPLLDRLIDRGSSMDGSLPAVSTMADIVVVLLKGVILLDSRAATNSLPNIIISTGPGSTGGRERSYSVGNLAGSQFISPYPKTMSDALLEILHLCATDTTGVLNLLCSNLMEASLAKSSWVDGVFRNFAKETKRKIATELLSIIASDVSGVIDAVFRGLPLDCDVLCHLFDHSAKEPENIVSIAVVADYVRSNSSLLAALPDVVTLLSSMFDLTRQISSSDDYDVDGIEFVKESLVSAMMQICTGVNDEVDPSLQKMNVPEDKIQTWASLLLQLIGGHASLSTVRRFESNRATAKALGLLAVLCKRCPAAISKSLVPAIEVAILNIESDTSGQNVVDAAGATFDIVIPVYCELAPLSGLTFNDLFNVFMSSVEKLSRREQQVEIYRLFVSSLVDNDLGANTGSKDGLYGSVGALLALCLSSELCSSLPKRKIGKNSSNSEFYLELLELAPQRLQISSLLVMLEYGSSLLQLIGSEKSLPETLKSSTGSNRTILPSSIDVLDVCMNGSSWSPKKSNPKVLGRTEAGSDESVAILQLAGHILLFANDSFILESIRELLKSDDEELATLNLRLWQELLVVHAVTSTIAHNVASDDEGELLSGILRLADEGLDSVQSMLPLHVFLASATSLIKEGGTDELRSRAIRLVADRASEVNAASPEASLFLEMVTILVEILKTPANLQEEDGPSQLILHQSALIAVEHVARALNPSGVIGKSGGSNSRMNTFLAALGVCSDILLRLCGKSTDPKSLFERLDPLSHQLVSSAALCSATLVRTTAPRCLPFLGKFMTPLIDCLLSANQFLLSSAELDIELAGQARMMQLSTLRTFTAVAQSVPTFMFPYLNKLLAPSALPSKALRSATIEPAMVNRVAAETLDQLLSSRVPARVLLPVASNALGRCDDLVEYQSLLRLLQAATSKSTGGEIASSLGSLTKALTKSYGFKGDTGDRDIVLMETNDLALELVLKLSEVQLLRLYSELREWRGDLDEGSPNTFADRRHAFWALSAALSKQLRSIFLSCLNSVFADAIKELKYFCACLDDSQSFQKSPDGRKKQRLSCDEDTPPSEVFMLSLQPLLQCLESAFRSDAREGGKWIQADDGQRYTECLEPLGRLLQCKIPANFPLREASKTDSLYSLIIHGESSDGGSVVGCLTALAGAAGNEQLWKPMNHTVLQACGNETRPEVRKAGLICLLSLIKSLGEEYMVLLPECLPVLSELLEDSDEEIAGLAQDCVALGEELLGESLEESLR